LNGRNETLQNGKKNGRVKGKSLRHGQLHNAR
jgi:hypothetical protein